MEVIHERCAGLDVHKETVVACLRVRERDEVRREVRRWATTTRELLELGGLAAAGGLHARRDGSDRRLLEAGVAHAGGRVRATAGQPGAYPQRAWAQKRH